MTIQEILKQSVKGDALLWVRELGGLEYPNVLVNEFINKLSDGQINILKRKFNGLGNISQIRDILAEIIIARKFMEYEPEFLAESDSSTPDIYLRTREEYIEVKRLGNSDDFENFAQKLHNLKKAIGSDFHGLSDKVIVVNENETRKEIKEFLNKKAKELLDKGREQLKDKEGFIYFLYSIAPDPAYAVKMKNQAIVSLNKLTEELLREYLEKYSKEYNIKILHERDINY